MSRDEFREWGEFYQAHPFDDFHRFHRPAALIAGSLGGGGEAAMTARLDWLQPPEIDDQHTDADRDLFRAAGITLRGNRR